jgi:hypothetical protein
MNNTHGFSSMTALYDGDAGLDFGKVNVAVPGAGGLCLTGKICITLTAQDTTGPDLKLMLYETTDDDWPG